MNNMSRRSRCTTLFPVLPTVSPMSGRLTTFISGKMCSNSPEYTECDHQYEGDCKSRGETDQDKHHYASEKESTFKMSQSDSLNV